MKMKTTIYVMSGLVFVVACGSASGVLGIRNLGPEFVSMFNAAPNSEPVDAQTIPLEVSFTTDPFQL